MRSANQNLHKTSKMSPIKSWYKTVVSNYQVYSNDRENAITDLLAGKEWHAETSKLLARIRHGKGPLRYPPPAGKYELIESDFPIEVLQFYSCGALLIIDDAALHIINRDSENSFICSAPGWEQHGVFWRCYVTTFGQSYIERISGHSAKQLKDL